MSTQKLYLDYSSSRALQMFLSYLIYKENISEDVSYYLFGPKTLSINEKENMIERHYRNFYDMLSLLTLYDKIVISSIEEPTLLSESFLNELGLYYSDNKPSLKKHFSLSSEALATLVFNNRDKIYNDFKQEKCYEDYWDCKNFSLADSFEYYYDLKYYDDILNCNFFETQDKFYGIAPKNIFHTGEYAFYEYLNLTFKSLKKSLYDQNSAFYSNLFHVTDMKQITIEECSELNNFVMNLDFTSKIGPIPYPKTIDDVLTFRKNDNMLSFRKVFSNWMQCFKNGDINLAVKIEKDVKRAKSLINTSNNINSLEKSIPIIIIKVFASKFPLIGDLFSISEYLTPYTIDRIYDNCSWVNLPSFNKYNDCFIQKNE